MILIDTNVVLDIVTRDALWAMWSLSRLEEAALRGPLVINDVVYAELAVRYEDVEQLDQTIGEIGLSLERIPRPALFLAGNVFKSYRQAGGIRTGVLPDFFIGAHAAVAGLPLLTRDTARYRTYFPTLELIAPA